MRQASTRVHAYMHALACVRARMTHRAHWCWQLVVSRWPVLDVSQLSEGVRVWHYKRGEGVVIEGRKDKPYAVRFVSACIFACFRAYVRAYMHPR